MQELLCTLQWLTTKRRARFTSKFRLSVGGAEVVGDEDASGDESGESGDIEYEEASGDGAGGADVGDRAASDQNGSRVETSSLSSTYDPWERTTLSSACRPSNVGSRWSELLICCYKIPVDMLMILTLKEEHHARLTVFAILTSNTPFVITPLLS